MIGTRETAFIDLFLFSTCWQKLTGAEVLDGNFSMKIYLNTWTSSAGHTAHVWVCVCLRACTCARMLERQTPDKHTVARCASELPYIFWSGAFISTLLNVSAGKVSSFDALRSPLISQKCHPVVMTEAIPLSLQQICCANNSEEQRSRIICTYPKKWMTQGWLLDSRQP